LPYPQKAEGQVAGRRGQRRTLVTGEAESLLTKLDGLEEVMSGWQEREAVTSSEVADARRRYLVW
jgi:hypothetical protein